MPSPSGKSLINIDAKKGFSEQKKLAFAALLLRNFSASRNSVVFFNFVDFFLKIKNPDFSIRTGKAINSRLVIYKFSNGIVD